MVSKLVRLLLASKRACRNESHERARARGIQVFLGSRKPESEGVLKRFGTTDPCKAKVSAGWDGQL